MTAIKVKKDDGSWQQINAVTGATGPQGATGPAGKDGSTGPVGATGPAGSGGGGGATDVQVFNYTGSVATWTKPANAVMVHVEVVHGGQGGGAGARQGSGSPAPGGRGGDGGGRADAWMPASILPATVSVYAGGGGAGEAAVTVNNTYPPLGLGALGQSSGFGTYLGQLSGTAYGGGGASRMWSPYVGMTGGNGADNFGGASSAQPSNSNHPIAAMGAGGGGSINGSETIYNPAFGYQPPYDTGGNNAAGAVEGAAGTNAPGTFFTGGGGGGGGAAGKTKAAGKGGDGGLYGGGGGGGGGSRNGYNSGAGGKGGDGVVVVTTYF